jgi:hypothetical protein
VRAALAKSTPKRRRDQFRAARATRRTCAKHS